MLFNCLLINSLFSQALHQASLYNPGIRMMDQAQTLDEYLDTVHYFEELARKFPSHWLARYYSGLGYLHASYRIEGNKAKDGLMDRAQVHIDEAFKLRPGDAEIHVLQAFLYQSRLQVNPELRGLSYSQKAEASIKKAVAANPSNPRAYFLRACNIYYTPAMFGGGAKKALSIFMEAREKYQAFKPEMPILPDWGEKENQQKLEECNRQFN